MERLQNAERILYLADSNDCVFRDDDICSAQSDIMPVTSEIGGFARINLLPQESTQILENGLLAARSQD